MFSLIVRTYASWSKAEQLCQNNLPAGHLVAINDKSELKYLARSLMTSRNYVYRTKYHKQRHQWDWKWNTVGLTVYIGLKLQNQVSSNSGYQY